MDKDKSPEGNAAPEWAELCSRGHCLSIFTAERALGKAALLLGTSGQIKREREHFSHVVKQVL